MTHRRISRHGWAEGREILPSGLSRPYGVVLPIALPIRYVPPSAGATDACLRPCPPRVRAVEDVPSVVEIEHRAAAAHPPVGGHAGANGELGIPTDGGREIGDLHVVRASRIEKVARRVHRREARRRRLRHVERDAGAVFGRQRPHRAEPGHRRSGNRGHGRRGHSGSERKRAIGGERARVRDDLTRSAVRRRRRNTDGVDRRDHLMQSPAIVCASGIP